MGKVPILITRLGIAWENVTISITSLGIAWEKCSQLIYRFEIWWVNFSPKSLPIKNTLIEFWEMKCRI